MKNRPTQELVSEAFLMALEQRQPTAGLIHHSDQGIQYAHHRDYHTRQEARSDIFDYMDLFYNRRGKTTGSP